MINASQDRKENIQELGFSKQILTEETGIHQEAGRCDCCNDRETQKSEKQKNKEKKGIIVQVEQEPVKHAKARSKIEKHLIGSGYEILSNNNISLNMSFFCEPFFSIKGLFSTKLEYVHSYDIVAKREMLFTGKKHTLFYVIEVDGWNTRHGQIKDSKNQFVEPKKTILQQQKKDRIACSCFILCSNIIKLCNKDVSVDFSFARVDQEEILECKNEGEMKQCLINSTEGL